MNEYRAWDTQLRRMVNLHDYVRNRLNDRYIYMRYSGQDDNNGTRIYESDTVTDGNDLEFVVKRIDFTFYLCGLDSTVIRSRLSACKTLKVTGNTFTRDTP